MAAFDFGVGGTGATHKSNSLTVHINEDDDFFWRPTESKRDDQLDLFDDTCICDCTISAYTFFPATPPWVERLLEMED